VAFAWAGIAGYIDNAPSEMDACYFHIATLVMAGLTPTKLNGANKWIGLGIHA